MSDRYDQPTRMPLDHGYEMYRNRSGGDRARAALSDKGERKRGRAASLRLRGWRVKLSGSGHCTHPLHPEIVSATIAAAYQLQEQWDASRAQKHEATSPTTETD